MEIFASAFDGLCIAEERSKSVKARTGGRRRNYDDDTEEYKSKNLHAERRRRQKLSDRLLALRALVPIITNMNKATIIEDAITYIQELQQNVEILKDHLKILEMESSAEEAAETKPDVINAAEEMKKNGIEKDVMVTRIEGNKLWVKIVFENKRGAFTNLLDAIVKIGFELTDFMVTSSKGAILVSSCLEGTHGGLLTGQQKEMLQEAVESAIED